VITVASRTLESHAWGLGVRPERVLYLPNGPAPFFAQRHPIALEAQIAVRRALGVGDAPLAVYAGHLTYASEVDLIIEALPAVVEVVTDIRVVIVGGGPGLKPLQERVQRLRLSDWVLFAGWRPQQELPELLAAADVALYPHRDTLINRAKSPSKITAYMAMGKPIVASSVGESAEYLEGGRAGLLVPPDDAQAFAKGMVTILRDKTLAAELGQRAYERVWAQYDWQKRVGTIERAYCIAIEAHAASRCKCRPQMVV
jgi:glycosyltransferase involved in cell wall biosynthesis